MIARFGPKSLDWSADSLFLNLVRAAKVECNRRARSTLTLGAWGMSAMQSSLSNEDQFADVLAARLASFLKPHCVARKKSLLYDLSFDDKGRVAMGVDPDSGEPIRGPRVWFRAGHHGLRRSD